MTGLDKEKIESANRELAAKWADDLKYVNVDIVDNLQYEVMMILGRIWKEEFDGQQQ